MAAIHFCDAKFPGRPHLAGPAIAPKSCIKKTRRMTPCFAGTIRDRSILITALVVAAMLPHAEHHSPDQQRDARLLGRQQ
jgi:hypothetical protein